MQAFLPRWRERLGSDRVLAAPGDLVPYSRDESDLPAVMPLAVLRPRNEEDVVQVVLDCSLHRIPVTVRGGGTGLEGAAIPTAGGIVLDLLPWKRILEICPEERVVVLEPGVVFDELNRRLSAHGLFFPPTPGGSSDAATIGGMVATDAGGLHALRYGGTRQWVRALRVVTGRGEVLSLGSRVPKASVGPDLVGLFVASEGTLGVITQITLGLAPIPESRRTLAAVLPTMNQACRSVPDLWMAAPDLASIEIVDPETLRIAGVSLSGALLLAEFHGMEEVVIRDLRDAEDLLRSLGGLPIPGDPNAHWALRHRLTRAVRESARPGGVLRTDAAVPLSHIESYVVGALEAARSLGRRLHAFGHAGLGIVHFLFPLGGEGAWTREEALERKENMARQAMALGGVVSGEHGLGLGNRGGLSWSPAEQTLRILLKSHLDPGGILNPGKGGFPVQTGPPS